MRGRVLAGATSGGPSADRRTALPGTRRRPRPTCCPRARLLGLSLEPRRRRAGRVRVRSSCRAAAARGRSSSAGLPATRVIPPGSPASSQEGCPSSLCPPSPGTLATGACHHPRVSGTLYLVGTPIGNLGDMTDRARETLAAVDVVAAEDTRRAGRLLERFGISARRVSLFEGNERRRTEQLLDELREGRDVAIISDAGMPGLSDPGFPLVRACIEEGGDVRVVPGPSAAVAALLVSGLPTDRVAFEGFLPRKAGQRRARLEAIRDDPRTHVVFESPLRVGTLLRDVVAVLGDRRVAVVRELTKLHEEVVRGRAADVAAQLSDRALKGEVVVVIEGAREQETADPGALVAEAQALVAGGMRKREAAGEVARRRGASANEIYRAMT